MVKLTIDYIKKISYKPSNCSKKSEKSLHNITHLSLPEKCIDSIADLSQMKNLSVLYLHHNNLQVIENLQYNDRLTHLYLQYNKINKMINLNGLRHLKKLYLGYNCISVVEGLDAVDNLEELHIQCQQLSPGETIYFDPRTVGNLANCLHVLDVSGNNISSLNDLKELRSIEKFDASNNCIYDLIPICSIISQWPRVKELDFRGNAVLRAPKYRDKIIASTQNLKTLDSKDISEVTRSFIKRFELIKEERRDKFQKANLEQSPFSEEVASIAQHLPPGLRQSISASAKKDANTRSKTLTLSLMKMPINSQGDDILLPVGGLQPRPSRKVSHAESLARSRQKAERCGHTNLPQIGDAIPTSSQSH